MQKVLSEFAKLNEYLSMCANNDLLAPQVYEDINHECFEPLRIFTMRHGWDNVSEDDQEYFDSFIKFRLDDLFAHYQSTGWINNRLYYVIAKKYLRPIKQAYALELKSVAKATLQKE